jgi:hypothetical protein
MSQLIAILSESWFYIFTHLIFTMALFHAAWWLLSRTQPTLRYNPVAATVLAATISFLFTGDQMVRSLHAQRVMAARNTPAPTGAAGLEQQIANLRGEFLRTVEAVTDNPTQVTPESKGALFQQFALIFPNGINDVRAYYNQLQVAYECQLSMFEDTYQTYKRKKLVKSDKTKGCEQLPGAFFNRQRLIPVEAVQNQEQIKQSIVEGKPNAPSEKDLKAMVDRQQSRLKVLATLFQ